MNLFCTDLPTTCPVLPLLVDIALVNFSSAISQLVLFMTIAKHARGSSLPMDLSVCGSSSKSQNKAAAELCGPCDAICIFPIITILLQKVKEQRHI